MKICCVGITTLDRIMSVDFLPSKDGKYFAHGYKEQGGGPAATAAVAIARLGAEVDMIARVGDDATGKVIIDELVSEKVNTDHMVVIPGATSTSASILVDNEASRIIVSYPSPSLVADPSALEKIDFSSYDMVLADVRWVEGTRYAFEQAKKHGVPTLLDADITDKDIGELVGLATHCVFSKPGLQKFAKTEDIDAALDYAQTICPNSVYVTLGADGVNFLDNGQRYHKNGFKVNAVDTTGAGDVFHGAMAFALCDGKNKEDAITFAQGCSALKCTKPGGRSGIPNKAEVDAFIAQR